MQLRILTLYEEDLEVPEMAMDFLPWVYLWTVLNFLGNCFCFFQLSEKIKSLEEELLEEKPWQLKGEVTGQKRPENSLLEETILFDHAVRMGKYWGRAFLRVYCRTKLGCLACEHDDNTRDLRAG